MADLITSVNQNIPGAKPTGNSPQTRLAVSERQAMLVGGNSLPAAVAPAGKAVPPEPAAAEVQEQVIAAVSDISDYIQTVSRQLQIHVDDVLGSTIITVLDKTTGDVVRQIPQEELVAVSRFLAEQQGSDEAMGTPIKGVLLDSEG